MGIAEAEMARYRLRVDDRTTESSIPRFTVGATRGDATMDIETSHDGGGHWSPPLRISLGGDRRIVGLERVTR